MKSRLSVSVIALAMAFVLALASPAQAVHGQVRDLNMVHRAFAGVVYLYVTFVVFTSMTPIEGVTPLQADDVDPAEDCSDNRPVEVQKKTSSGWKTVKEGKTNTKAKFAAKMKDKRGTYRVMVPQYMTPNGIQCFEAVSKPKTHKH